MEVAKEYPQSTSQVYVPRCVALHRCGGCCNTDAFYCSNTSYTLVNKTVSCLRHRAIFWRFKLLGKQQTTTKVAPTFNLQNRRMSLNRVQRHQLTPPFSNFQLIDVSPSRKDRAVIVVTFVNHTSCECLSRRPLHAIIRRSATDHL